MNTPLRFAVLVDQDEFRILSSPHSGAMIEGQLWVSIGGVDFPARGWVDYPLAILAGWCPKVAELSRAKHDMVQELFFLDGSYKLTLSYHSAEIDLVAWVIKMAGDEQVASMRCPASELVMAVAKAGELVHKWANDHGVSNRDVATLGSALEALNSSRA